MQKFVYDIGSWNRSLKNFSVWNFTQRSFLSTLIGCSNLSTNQNAFFKTMFYSIFVNFQLLQTAQIYK